MLPKWTVKYSRNDNPDIKKEVDVFGETVFQAWFNAMNIIQIIEKTEEYFIKGVNPKKSN